MLGNYTKAAAGFRERGEFGIYVGNAMLIFELFRPRSGWLGSIAEHWQRYRLRGGMPIGVVAGPANALPREWARAWQVSRAGDAERMERGAAVLEAFREARRAGGKRSIACLKRALRASGVIGSDAVAPGTPALAPEEAERFDAAFERVRRSRASASARRGSRGDGGSARERARRSTSSASAAWWSTACTARRALSAPTRRRSCAISAAARCRPSPAAWC